MRATNLTLLTDLYELTMMQGYFKNPTNQTVIFDMFYRTNPCGGAFAITAGLEQMIEYIENLKFTDEDIEYLRSLNIFEEDFLEYLSNPQRAAELFAQKWLLEKLPEISKKKICIGCIREEMEEMLKKTGTGPEVSLPRSA
mgnify:FL=1